MRCNAKLPSKQPNVSAKKHGRQLRLLLHGKLSGLLLPCKLPKNVNGWKLTELLPDLLPKRLKTNHDRRRWLQLQQLQ